MLPVYSDAVSSNPRKLFLFSHTKVGKTTLVSKLPNNLIIDCEDGSDFLDGIKYNLTRESKLRKVNRFKLLKELAAEIESENAKRGDYLYDFITYDTVTALEDLARIIATKQYKESVIGKNFEGEDVVRELAQGAG